MFGSKAKVQFRRADGTVAKFQAKEGRRRKTNRPLTAYQRFVKANIRTYLPKGRKLTPADMGRAMKLVSQLWNRRAGDSTSAGQVGYGGPRDTGDVFYKTTSKSKSKSKRKVSKKKAAPKKKAAAKKKTGTKRTASKTSKTGAAKRTKKQGTKRTTTAKKAKGTKRAASTSKRKGAAKRSSKTGRFQKRK